MIASEGKETECHHRCYCSYLYISYSAQELLYEIPKGTPRASLFNTNSQRNMFSTYSLIDISFEIDRDQLKRHCSSKYRSAN